MRSDPLWAATCRGLADLLADPSPGPSVTVIPLGTRDEFAVAEPIVDGTIPVHLYGRHAIIGPFPVDGQHGPACPRCLARRWQSVRSATLRDTLELGGDTTATGASPYATPFAAAAVRGVLDAHRASAIGHRETHVYQLDLETLQVRRWPLLPDPECPHCLRSTPDTAEAAVLSLPPAPKRDGFRVRGVDEYPLVLDAFANPLCGALGPTLRHDITSVTTSPAIGSFSLRSGPYLRETLFGGHADSYARSSRISVLEGLERAAGLRARGKPARVFAAFDALGADALDPRTSGVHTDEFYARNPYVLPFSPAKEIAWVWGYSLRDQRPILVPEVLAYYHATTVEDRFVQETSNGCASGGHLAEAIYFGLMEVIERDAFLLTWFGRQSLPEIDPQSSARPATRQMVDRLAMYGYEARFFDARITFDIPIVIGAAVRPDGGLGTMCFGGGASLDPEAAMSAALCEIATDSVKLRGRTLADEARLRAMVTDFDLVRGLHDHPLVYGLPEMAAHASFLLGPSRRHTVTELFREARPAPPVGADLRADLTRCVGAVTDAGFDVIVVDQTMPEQRDLGLHTVCVLVPGLVPIDFGWMRQRAPHLPRTRTALRRAGLRDRDLRPDELNPAPHPFP